MIKNSLGSSIAKLSTSKIITSAVAMVITMLLSRLATLEEYGTYSQVLLVINIVTVIFMLGLPNSINYFLGRADTESEKQEFLSVYYTLSTIFSFITGLVLVTSTPIIVGYFGNGHIKSFWYVLAVYPWTKIILSGIENIFIVYKVTSWLVAFRIMNSLFLLATVAIVQVMKWSFGVYMLIFVIGEAIFALSVYIIAKKLAGKIKISFDIRIIKLILKYSIPIGFASIVGTLNIELGKLIIGGFLNTEQLAIYTNASKELPVTMVAISITAVLLPKMARLLKNQEHDRAVALWGSSTALSYTILCLLASGFFVFAPDIMTLLYSEKYLPGVSVFRVYTLVLLLRCTYFGMILNAMGKTKLIMYSSFSALLLNCVFTYVLYIRIGFVGPAIANLFSQSAVNLLQLIFTSKAVSIPLKKIMPWRLLVIISGISGLLGILFYFVKDYAKLELYTGELFESIILGLIWSAIYLALLIKPLKKQWYLLNKES